jgi:HEAT repeat protein
MPLVKRGGAAIPPGHKAPEDRTASHVSALADSDPDTRWNAARALGSRAEAVPELAAALSTEQVPRVRQALVTALMRIGDDASVCRASALSSLSDAAVRSSAIEALQGLPEAVGPFVAGLLQDGDSDVRILASELVRNLSAEKATRILCSLIEGEQHPNVCAAAIDVLAEVGTPAALPALHACAKRFSETPFLPFAISVAISRITGAGEP